MTLALSPSTCHDAVMDSDPPRMRYVSGSVFEWQRPLRRKTKSFLGLAAMPRGRVPLRPRTLWRRDHPSGSIEKVAFTSEPGADVTGYVCLPHGVSPPYPFFICLQGHNSGMHNSIGIDEREKDWIPIDDDRDFGIGCMTRGIAAFCIEQRGFGDRQERELKLSGNRCHDPMWRAELLGRTLAGERVYDVDRSIDYLASRGDVDMRRLGVTGLSGGGMVAICSAAVLPRIRLAMPASHFCTYRDGLMSIHHCGCCYVPGILRYGEMADVMGLFAPKPVVVVTGKADPSKPIRGVRKAFRDLKRIYEAAGAGDKCRLVVGEEGHRFYADAAWKQMLRL